SEAKDLCNRLYGHRSCHPERSEGPMQSPLPSPLCHPERSEGPMQSPLSSPLCHPERSEGPMQPPLSSPLCHPERSERPMQPLYRSAFVILSKRRTHAIGSIHLYDLSAASSRPPVNHPILHNKIH